MRKQDLEIGEAKGLRESERKVLEALLDWNFQAKKPNFFNIAEQCGLADCTCNLALRHLRNRGYILKSIGGAWHINEQIRSKLRPEPIVEEKKEEKVLVIE